MRKQLAFFIFPMLTIVALWTSQCTTSAPPKTVLYDSPFLNLRDSASYVGMETCKGCHLDVYNTFIQTGMGQSFGLATKAKSAAHFSEHTVVYDSVNDLSYHPYWHNDTLYIQEYRVTNGDTVHNLVQAINYVIGSGQHTNSHLFSVNGYMFQAPITFYTQKGTWDFAPGFEQGFNSRFTRVIGDECMTCHNALPEFDTHSLNKFTSVPLGINCERCHGPGSIHVKEKLAGIFVDTTKQADYTIVNPKRLDKDRQMSLCQRCHLQGVAVLNKGKTWHDFKPGMNLKDVMQVFLPRFQGAENDFIMASQADRLRLSKCYAMTDMTCITCHNPHISVKVTPIDHFNNACIGCHKNNGSTAPAFGCKADSISLVTASYNCSGCHMPKSGSIDIPHVSITDHFIRTHYDTAIDYNHDLVAVDRAKKFIGLQCLTDTMPSALDMAEGYLHYYEKYSPRPYLLDSAKAYLDATGEVDSTNFKTYVYWAYLKQDFNEVVAISQYLKPSQISDGWTAYRIGEGYMQLGGTQPAQQYFEVAVSFLSDEPSFWNKLASVYVANKEVQRADTVYEKLIVMQPDYKEAYANLGYLELIRGRYTRSGQLLDQALHLDPDYVQALLNRAILHIRLNEKDKAKTDLERILELDPEQYQAQQMLDMI